ncbi:coiled-coil domain-containing protein [Vibrio methylphosphonaticus]|uniref:hypothetical protein n=1 Tax=Vibrio methylphosphonaticus TaxID=2946866 RepID=UPI00202AA375|nr:hypothetical protein [Vibrio methylphosphonaticus]MCL9776884.1 hypothetical protein [Vibrio methylphosphonaticus]
MDKLIALSRLLFAFALIALAAAIYSFTQEAKQLRTELPALLAQVDTTAQRITPVIAEINNLQSIVPSILEQSAEYQRLIPEVLQRIDDINQQLPLIVSEVEQVRDAIPPIIEQSDAWHRSLPTVLKQVDQTNQTVRQTNQQISNVNQKVPEILAESAALRKDVPEIIVQAEGLVAQAEQAGREASKGAVSGVIGGILNSPFQLVDKITDVSSETFGLKQDKSYTDSDRDKHKAALTKLMKTPQKGQSTRWSNSRSGNSGEVIIQSVTNTNDATCYSVLSRLNIDSGPDKGTHNVITDKCIDN